jgi:hypothetical protein
MTESTRRAVERAAYRSGKSFSATAAELIERQLAQERENNPIMALVGVANKKLPYSAADIDDELAKSWAEDIRRDSGLA